MKDSMQNNDDVKALLCQAIDVYGGDRQLIKCCEEMGELTQAICKRFDLGAEYSYDLEAVVEELADVEIMLDQLRLYLKIDPEMERKWRERKLARLAVRLGR